MQKCYMVVTGTINDPIDYMNYVEAVVNLVNVAGGKWLVRNPESDVREGSHGPLTAVVEWPSVEIAKGAYDSAEYQEIKKLRMNGNSELSFSIVEGCDPDGGLQK